MTFFKERGMFIKIIFFIICFVVIIILIKRLIIKWFKKTERISNLKKWKIPSREIIWIVKEIEIMAGGTGLAWKYITTWYILVEWKNPITKKIQTYKSQTYTHKEYSSNRPVTMMAERVTEKDKEAITQYINKYIKIGDKIKIKVSLEDPNDYIVEDIIN